MPNFTAEFDALKVSKHNIDGVKYSGIALKPDVQRELEKRASRKRKGARPTETAAHRSRPAVDEAAALAAERLRAAGGEMQAALDKSSAADDKSKAA